MSKMQRRKETRPDDVYNNGEAQHSYYSAFRYAITFFAVIALSAAFLGLQSVPIEEDLFHSINPGYRPGKGEGTIMYLFVFPFFLAGGALINWIFPGLVLSRAPKSRVMFILYMIVALLLYAAFFVVAIVRVYSAATLQR